MKSRLGTIGHGAELDTEIYGVEVGAVICGVKFPARLAPAR